METWYEIMDDLGGEMHGHQGGDTVAFPTEEAAEEFCRRIVAIGFRDPLASAVVWPMHGLFTIQMTCR